MSDLLARLIAVAFVSGLFVPGLAAHAQESGYYYPLNQRLPLGEVARWNATIHPGLYGQTQPVRITLPSTGHVTYYDGRSPQGVLADAPSQAGLLVGNVYRVRISGMPEFPGIELYPSIELLDRLHPPPGQEQNFPVPVTFTVEEIETALQDRMVTKVVYLEQPQRAAPFDQKDGPHIEDVPPSSNLLEAADQRGRPIAIVRLGGRIPDANAGAAFFGPPVPVVFPTQVPQPPAQP
ncbi:MAG: hypothetical protein ACF8PG_14055 [Maioricimonas sp. JB045]|uniref:hypothetical protein n=1 Tax=Maioricimonas sp. JC845 TaxID=3232138 RepID=UPI00345B4720